MKAAVENKTFVALDRKDYIDIRLIMADMRENLEDLEKEFSNYYWKVNHSDKYEAICNLIDNLDEIDGLLFTNKVVKSHK